MSTDSRRILRFFGYYSGADGACMKKIGKGNHGRFDAAVADRIKGLGNAGCMQVDRNGEINFMGSESGCLGCGIPVESCIG
ncbi:hypothetical protein BOTNAR_0538g00060 [Botryotinia narcissicola]|uniref:Uncharacterized protein n=1 Tax=Botryotinia narcissicola TaxID=278944 RepID=A0A4Z1HKA3_9HELO|nr:hypothetical protein BOTNAR_0538g00060 [Botryotinia narcissicola]